MSHSSAMVGLASNPEVWLKSPRLAVCLINTPAVRAGCDSAGGPKHSPGTTWQNRGRQVTASHVEAGEQDVTGGPEEDRKTVPQPLCPPTREPCTFTTPHAPLGKSSRCTHTGWGGPGPSKAD